ncbi:hypothetical protein O3P69_004316 [Scylla paramamosain]|uniref:Secreted protein n=1 Tax=Scylla paramamosain TaxID=85552 RepID=A0AAW0ULQ9_SCYPA
MVVVLTTVCESSSVTRWSPWREDVCTRPLPLRADLPASLRFSRTPPKEPHATLLTHCGLTRNFTALRLTCEGRRRDAGAY